MKKERTKNKKYPLVVTMSTGEKMKIPRQSQFDNEWLRKHGCSIMAEYIALEWLGVKKIGKENLWPVTLLRWHKKHTPDMIAAKLLIKGTAEGINKLSDGQAVYYKGTTRSRMTKALVEGKLVIFEQKDPIHTVILLPDRDGIFVASHGTVRKTTVDKMISTALRSTKYKGMVVVSK